MRLQLTCAQLVELVTDYLEQSLPVSAAERFEEHVAFCEGCGTYLGQMRETIAVAGRLRADDLPPELEERLLEAFRDWSAA